MLLLKSITKFSINKSYIFNVNDNSIFCIVSHFIALIFHDDVFATRDLNCLNLFFDLSFINNKCTLISWKENKLSILVFRLIERFKDEAHVFASKSLSYNIYYAWVTRLDENLDFSKILITYCLRWAINNAINDISFYFTFFLNY